MPSVILSAAVALVGVLRVILAVVLIGVLVLVAVLIVVLILVIHGEDPPVSFLRMIPR